MICINNLCHLGCFLRLLGVIFEVIGAQLRKSKDKLRVCKPLRFLLFCLLRMHGFCLNVTYATREAVTSEQSTPLAMHGKAWEVRRVLRTPPSFSQNEVPQVCICIFKRKFKESFIVLLRQLTIVIFVGFPRLTGLQSFL